MTSTTLGRADFDCAVARLVPVSSNTPASSRRFTYNISFRDPVWHNRRSQLATRRGPVRGFFAMNTVVTLLLTAGLLAGGSISSGPQVGDKLGDFKAHAFSGADAGKEFKFLDKSKGGPTLLIFVQ